MKRLLPLCCVLVACTPRVSWQLPVEVRDENGPVAGVEVAVAGRFAGATDAAGKLMLRVDAAPKESVALSLRHGSLESIHLARVLSVELPSVWEWLSTAGLSGEALVPPTILNLPRLDVPATALAPDGEDDEFSTDTAADTSQGVTRAAAPDTIAAHESELPPDPAVEISVAAKAAAAAAAVPAGPATQGTGGTAATTQGDVNAQKAARTTEESAASVAAGASSNANSNVIGAAAHTPAPSGSSAESKANGPNAPEKSALVSSTPSNGSEMRSVPLPEKRGRTTLSVQVYSEGKALVGAEISSLRTASGRIVHLGATDEKGVLESDHPAPLLGGNVLVRHPCCVSAVAPLAQTRVAATALEGAVARTVRVDLVPGASHDFVFVEHSYGAPRLLDKATLASSGRTLDVTGPTGVALIQSKNLPQGLAALDVSLAESFPARRSVAVPISATTEAKPFLVRLSPARRRLAQVGLVEMVKGEVVHAETHLQGEPLYRRARRDFISRFVQERTLRPLIFQEVKKLADAVGVDPTRLVREGWELGPLAAELDFVVTLEPLAEGGLVLRLVNGEGRQMARQVFRYGTSQPPEVSGQAAFEALLASLPFEFTVAETASPNSAVLAVGDDFARVIRRGDRLRRITQVQRNVEPSEPGAPCEGTLGADGKSMALLAVCTDVAPGDVFVRERAPQVSAGAGTLPAQ